MSVALVGLRVVLALAVVLALVWFAGRKLSGTPGLRRARSMPLTVLGRQSLGKGSGIALVEVAGRVLLLGVGDQGVRVLTEIDVPAAEAAAAQAAATAAAAVAAAAQAAAQATVLRSGPTVDDFAVLAEAALAEAALADDDATYVLREELDLATLVGPYPDGSGRLAARTVGAAGTEPGTSVDPVALAHLAGLAASSGSRGASALQGSILSRDTWRRAVDAVQQRTVRR